MKNTRILLILAAALSLGLAVFTSVRTNKNAVASAQASIRVADDNVPFVPAGDDDDDDSGGGGNSTHMI
jgi:hypothetical protein